MKLGQIMDFMAFYNAVKGQKMPLKTSYNLVKMNTALNTHLEFYQTSLRAIAEEFGAKDENGELELTEQGGWKILPDKIDECNSKLVELQLLDIDDLPTIKFSINDFANVDVEPELLMGIEEFLED